MARDGVIEKAFTTADDAMQGLWGLQPYVRAAVLVADRNQLCQKLPQGAFRLTHEWERYYDPDQLICELGKVGEYVISRMCLVSLVAVFEAAVKQFHLRLVDLDRVAKLNSPYYKTFLKWAFETVRANPLGSDAAIHRLPERAATWTTRDD